MASGSDSITIARSKPRKRTLNCSPMRRLQCSIRLIGRASHQAVCASGGTAGVGGSVLILSTSLTDAASRGAGRRSRCGAAAFKKQLLDVVPGGVDGVPDAAELVGAYVHRFATFAGLRVGVQRVPADGDLRGAARQADRAQQRG